MTGGNNLPDIYISGSDIWFSNEFPNIGDNIIIGVTVHNSSTQEIHNFIVRFYDGNPNSGGIQIGSDQTINSIAPGGSQMVGELLMSINTSHDIYVVVDADNSIQESNENNNTASRILSIYENTGTNLFANSGFESNTDGWVITKSSISSYGIFEEPIAGSGFGCTTCDDYPRKIYTDDGSKVFWMRRSGSEDAPTYVQLKQTVTLPQNISNPRITFRLGNTYAMSCIDREVIFFYPIEIYIDGVLVTTWNIGANNNHRFGGYYKVIWTSFGIPIPRSALEGKDSVTIAVRFVSKSTSWGPSSHDLLDSLKFVVG